jgi:signal transduction histidine kinase
MTLVIAIFFLLEFAALFFSSRSFFEGLTHLHELNRATEIMRQSREAVTSVKESLDRAEAEKFSPESVSVLLSGTNETRDLILQARVTRMKTESDPHFVEEALNSFDEFRGLLGRIVESRSKSQALLADQYLVETIDALTKAQIRATGESAVVFNEVSRTRFRPMAVGGTLAVVFVAIILAIGLLTARRINRSIQRLVDATKEVGSGNFRFNPPQLEADEIGYLSNAFSSMTDSLRETTVSRNYVVNVIDSMRDAVLFLEEDGRIRRCNRRTPEILGFHFDDLSGKKLDLIFPEGITFFGDLKNHEALGIKKDGTRIPLSVTISPLHDRDAASRGFVCVIADITERKRNEAALHNRTTALGQANRELEAFSYSVSHDLRAPLRALDGFSHALVEDYGDKLDAEALRYLDRIRAASQTMGKLIDDLLNLSRLSRSEMNVVDCDLTAMAKEIVESLRERDPNRKVEFIVEPKLIAPADASLMRAAMTNLLDNAWKYTSKVPVAKIEFRSEMQNDTKVFFVRDNGAGFNMEYSKKLFGAFQRLHTASEFPGTGVGLATVLRIIRRHGGDAWAKGEVGKGATFYFVLPATKS